MKKNAIFWIREDFRIEHNPALSFASQNHDNVIALFIYNKTDFDKKREAQKWWLYKSLVEFKSELFKYKINLQILEGDEIDILSKIKNKDNISVYWNKIYEPDVIAKGKKIRDTFLKNGVEFKYFKGNILNEFQEVTKNDGTPFKVFSPFWRNAEEKYLSLPPSKNYVVKKKINEGKEDKEIYDFLFNLAPSDPFKLVPIEKPISMSASKHIGYAIQWFGLSVVLVVMTLIAFLKKNE